MAEPASGPQVLSLPMNISMFDYLAQRQGVEVTKLEFALLLEDGVSAGAPLTLTPSIGVGDLDLAQPTIDQVEMAYMFDAIDNLSEALDTWTLSLADDAAPAAIKDGTRLDRSKIVGMLMIVRYTLLDTQA